MDMIPHNVPQKQCTQCKEYFPPTSEFFYTNRGKLTWYCKECIKSKQRTRNAKLPKKREKVPDGFKQCFVCKELKEATLENFYAKGSGKYGVDGTCKKCHIQRTSTEHFYLKGQEEKYLLMRSDVYRRYRKAHMEEDRIRSRNRRALKKQAEGTHTKEDILAQYHRQKGKCYYCHKKIAWGKHHVDHVIPLSRGGTNWTDNLVIACEHCNESKSTKLPHEFWQGGRLL